MAALSYLQQMTGQSLADHVRQAILVYTRQHPSFDPHDFASAAKLDIRSELDDPELRDSFDAQLDAFTKDLAKKRDPDGSMLRSIPRFKGSTVFKDSEED